MKKLLTLIFLLTCLTSFADSWTQKASVGGSQRNDAIGFSIPAVGKGYVGIGGDGLMGFLQDLWEYDPVNNTWTQKADYPGLGRVGAMAFCLGAKAYIGGGYNGAGDIEGDFWEYDPSLNEWTQKSNLPAGGRCYGFAFAIGAKGYIGTGWNCNWYPTSDFWEYDPISDAWSQKADYGGGTLDRGAGVATSTKGYVCLGNPNYNHTLWEYDPLSNLWSPKANFLGPMIADVVAFSICDEVYLGTGETWGAIGFTDQLWKYNPANDAWIQKANFIGGERDEAVGFSLLNKAYIGTGGFGLSDWYEYTPDSATCSSFVTTTGVCEKFCTDYFDFSNNSATAWQWLFPGGSPSSSIDQNPTNICYNVPGTYDVILITTGAGGNDTLALPNHVIVHPTPPIPTITQSDYTLTSSSASSYQWQFKTVEIPGATNQSCAATQSGLYTVIVSDEYGCANAASIDVVLSGMQVLPNESFVSVTPNPSNGIFTLGISCPSGSDFISLEIVDAMGRQVFSSDEIVSAPQFKKEIQLQDIPSGIYFINGRSSLEYFTTTLVIAK